MKRYAARARILKADRERTRILRALMQADKLALRVKEMKNIDPQIIFTNGGFSR